ncbi:hypothetical protein B0H14DRAFT_2618134 [Mycena olivaceomarginata]|nr:hypothetical protein B0H14DRAFT_2618134 [Mycena olivaceomarginata]
MAGYIAIKVQLHLLQEEQDGAYITPLLIPRPALLFYTGKQCVEMADTSTYVSRISCTCVTPRSADETQVAQGQHGSFSLRTSAPTSPVLLSQHWRKGVAQCKRQRSTWHTRGDTYMHVVVNPRAPAPRRDKAEQTRDPPKKKKTKENKMMPPWKGLLPETVVYFSFAVHGAETGVSIVDEKMKWKMRQGDCQRGVELRECYKSNSTSATQATRIKKRGSPPVPPERSKRKKSDVMHDRLFGPASNISLLLCHLVPCVEDEITDAKKAKKDEEEQARL